MKKEDLERRIRKSSSNIYSEEHFRDYRARVLKIISLYEPSRGNAAEAVRLLNDEYSPPTIKKYWKIANLKIQRLGGSRKKIDDSRERYRHPR